jgi:hypothetical protein
MIIGLRKEITKLFTNIYERHHQVSKCNYWCHSGILTEFSTEQKSRCDFKCNEFAYFAPFPDFLCQVFCPYSKLFLDSDCMNTDFCQYYKDVVSLEVKNAVKRKWNH